MWIVYTTKPGDTMDTIIAKQKIKDPATVLTHKANKPIYKDLKAGKPLPKGTKVTIPDPKGKVYVVKTQSGTKYMSEAAYKDYLKGVNEKMDEALFALKQRFTYATGRHDAQLKINNDQWIVAFCLEAVNSVPEPKSRKKAESAFKAAEKACKARNYKGFEKAAEPANQAIAVYKTEVLSWIDGLINAGENTVTVLDGVKKVGMVCGAVAATSVIAPAGLAAGVLTGAVTGGGTQMAYDGFDSIGRAIVGSKQRSTGETLKRAATGAVVGAGGALVVGLLMKVAAPIIANTASSSKFVEAQVKRIVTKAPGNLGKLYEAEVKSVLGRMGFVESTEVLLKARGAILYTALTKLSMRLAMGYINKRLNSGSILRDYVGTWISGDAKRVSGKSPEKTAQALANDFAKSKEIDTVFDDMISDNESAFRKILAQEIKAVAVVEMKKQKA
ncbi:MAG: hypothetical protein AAGB05_16035 [Pseudomonadota bacterium]